MKKSWGGLVVGAVVALAVGMVVASTPGFHGVLDALVGRKTMTISGDAVVQKLEATSELTVAKGTFGVPVVVCNTWGEGRAYTDRKRSDDLSKACTGTGDEKATVIVQPTVEAVIDLKSIRDDDVKIEGKKITLAVPEPTLAPPEVDAETDILIVSIESSIWPGKLPDNYLAMAAGAGKKEVTKVAQEAGILDLGKQSTRSIFEGLLGSFGFADVDVKFKPDPS